MPKPPEERTRKWYSVLMPRFKHTAGLRETAERPNLRKERSGERGKGRGRGKLVCACAASCGRVKGMCSDSFLCRVQRISDGKKKVAQRRREPTTKVVGLPGACSERSSYNNKEIPRVEWRWEPLPHVRHTALMHGSCAGGGLVCKNGCDPLFLRRASQLLHKHAQTSRKANARWGEQGVRHSQAASPLQTNKSRAERLQLGGEVRRRRAHTARKRR